MPQFAVEIRTPVIIGAFVETRLRVCPRYVEDVFGAEAIAAAASAKATDAPELERFVTAEEPEEPQAGAADAVVVPSGDNAAAT